MRYSRADFACFQIYGTVHVGRVRSVSWCGWRNANEYFVNNPEKQV
jgi:hypothetical protein